MHLLKYLATLILCAIAIPSIAYDSKTEMMTFKDITSNEPRFPYTRWSDLADVDGDGRVDLIYTDDFNGPGSGVVLSWVPNDGSKLPFGERVGLGPNRIRFDNRAYPNLDPNRMDGIERIQDLNADGFPDLLIIQYDHRNSIQRISWSQNTGTDPHFADPELVISRNPFLREIGLGDLDGDGDLDIVGTVDAGFGYYQSVMIINEGVGSFGPFSAPVSVGDQVRQRVRTLELEDIDGDGDIDILEGRANLNNTGFGVTAFLNNGTAVPFSPNTRLRVLIRDGEPTSLAVADLNDDSLPDLVAAGDDLTRYYLNTGASTLFDNAPANLFGSADRTNSSVVISDLSGDGRPDIQLVDFYGDKVRWFINTGEAVPIAVTDAGTEVGILGEYVASADIDGDGDIDILADDQFRPSINLNSGYVGNPLPELLAESQSIREDQGPLIVNLALSEPSSEPVTVEFGTTPLNSQSERQSEPGKDFYGVFEVVRFEPGETIKTIPITILEDDEVEFGEAFFGILSFPQGLTVSIPSYREFYRTPKDTLRFNLLDGPRDATPELSLGRLTRSQESSEVLLTSVTLNHGTTLPVEVTLETFPVAGGATPGQDYTSTRKTLVIEPGERSVLFEVPIVFDAESEGEESFGIRASNVQNATLMTPEVTAIIIDDRSNPVASISDDSLRIDEGEIALIPVKLNRQSIEPVSIYMASQSRTAQQGPGEDFYGIYTKLTFAPGETLIEVPIQTLRDQVPETIESFRVRLLNPDDGLNFESGWISVEIQEPR